MWVVAGPAIPSHSRHTFAPPPPLPPPPLPPPPLATCRHRRFVVDSHSRHHYSHLMIPSPYSIHTALLDDDGERFGSHTDCFDYADTMAIVDNGWDACRAHHHSSTLSSAEDHRSYHGHHHPSVAPLVPPPTFLSLSSKEFFPRSHH